MKLSKNFTTIVSYIRKNGELINISERNGWVAIAYGDIMEGVAYRLEVPAHPAIVKYVNMRLKPMLPQFNKRVALVKKYNVKRDGYDETRMKVTIEL